MLAAFPVNAFITAASLGVACAVLSLVVILRSWAFIGEGIGHAGFGGIGTAWLLSLAFPALGADGPVYMVAVIFCLAVALGIGFLSRGTRLNGDTAIGIFMVTALAWGFIALAIYQQQGHGTPDWERYLLGNMSLVSSRAAVGAVCAAAAVVVIVAALRKEILSYAFDPELARISGVRAGFIHYLLMILLAAVIIIGMGLAGTLLAPAMLILPGATALLLTRRLTAAAGLSVAVSLIGALGGCLISRQWRIIPPGAAMVLIMSFLFALALAGVGLRRRVTD